MSEENSMTQAEKETIEAFCRELALALSRITGLDIDFQLTTLPIKVQNPDHISDHTDRAGEKRPKDAQ